MKILLAREAGFCFGVERAIDMVQQAREDQPRRSIDILNEIVHNKHVIESFERQGVHSVPSVDSARDGVLVISAHGVSPEVVRRAEERGLEVLDVTCPLVTRIHRTAAQLVSQGYEVVLLGDAGHDEVSGVRGVAPEHIHLVKDPEDLRRLPGNWSKVALVSQTTQGLADFERMESCLRERYPALEVHNTICNATELRQEAVHELARQSQLVYVVGSANSANAKRLRDIAQEYHIPAFLIEDAGGIRSGDLKGVDAVGVSAGASTPDHLIRQVLVRLKELGGSLAEQDS